MDSLTAQILVAALTAVPFILLYWVLRFFSRSKSGRALRAPRPWQEPTLRRWVERGWLNPERVEALPEALVPTTVLYEWAWADREVARHWRFRHPLQGDTSLEAMVEDLWRNLPESVQTTAAERLRDAVSVSSDWWGGAERGWNGRPLALLAADIGKKQGGLPLLPMDDLTAAPLPGPMDGKAVADTADGPDLVFALAVLRRIRPGFMHPLAPKAGAGSSMIQGLSTRVASDLGRKLGAGFGAALGPIGSMLGQQLGELAGNFTSKAVATQMLPEPVQNALKETERTLSHLGELAETEAFKKAGARPGEAILEFGKQMEAIRHDRSRRFLERIWPSPGLVLLEEVLRVTLSDLKGYRAAGEHLALVARRSPEPVAGGMILQNPWLAAHLKGAPERLNAARAALNRAALSIRRAPDG